MSIETYKYHIPNCVLKFVNWFHVSNKVFALLLTIPVAFMAPNIDGYFRPAVSSFIIDKEASYRSDSYIYLSGILVKERCTFMGVTVNGLTMDGKTISLPILYQDNKLGQNVNREKGSQPFGPWRVYVAASDDVWGIQLSSAHMCNLQKESKYFENFDILSKIKWVISNNLGEVILTKALRDAKSQL